MVKHNNVIPNVHLRKHWQKNVKVWLNQAGRKKRRLQARKAKAQAFGSRPIDNLRPAVRCSTIRYNHRVRTGRGTKNTLTQDSLSLKLKPQDSAPNSPDQSESQSIIVEKTEPRNLWNSIKTASKTTSTNWFCSPGTRRNP